MSAKRIMSSLLSLILFFSVSVSSADEEKAGAVTSPTPDAEEIEVDQIKERYWGRGDENQVGVVQDRIHIKRRKIEISLAGGIAIGDPFLNTASYGGTLGYHFSELYSLHAIWWFASVRNSSSLTALERDTGTAANTNKPRHYLGGELRGSFLYGKLSLFGTQILHFDTYLSLGSGSINTETGSNLAVTAGVGQQFHLSRLFAFNLDFKVMRYGETIVQKQTGQVVPIGQALGDRTNLSCVITVGISVLY